MRPCIKKHKKTAGMSVGIWSEHLLFFFGSLSGLGLSVASGFYSMDFRDSAIFIFSSLKYMAKFTISANRKVSATAIR